MSSQKDSKQFSVITFFWNEKKNGLLVFRLSEILNGSLNFWIYRYFKIVLFRDRWYTKVIMTVERLKKCYEANCIQLCAYLAERVGWACP